MKLRNILTLLLVAGLLASAKPAGDSGLVDIINLNGKKLPADGDVYHRRQHDVMVYISDMSDTSVAYTILFYRTENQILRCYQATYGAQDPMEQAGYRWLNDSLVRVHLFNTKTRQTMDFLLTGYGIGRGNKTTTIKREDKN